uniref:Uncharacterized protein n=1 Tax=Rhizophora mucronata TaxID=61149 RepID=A0A2P2PRS4_RHIMU
MMFYVNVVSYPIFCILLRCMALIAL